MNHPAILSSIVLALTWGCGEDRCEQEGDDGGDAPVVEKLALKWLAYAKRTRIHPFYLQK